MAEFGLDPVCLLDKFQIGRGQASCPGDRQIRNFVLIDIVLNRRFQIRSDGFDPNEKQNSHKNDQSNRDKLPGGLPETAERTAQINADFHIFPLPNYLDS